MPGQDGVSWDPSRAQVRAHTVEASAPRRASLALRVEALAPLQVDVLGLVAVLRLERGHVALLDAGVDHVALARVGAALAAVLAERGAGGEHERTEHDRQVADAGHGYLQWGSGGAGRWVILTSNAPHPSGLSPARHH